jgi:cytoskeletal protein CcmA (bactofilin family)
MSTHRPPSRPSLLGGAHRGVDIPGMSGSSGTAQPAGAQTYKPPVAGEPEVGHAEGLTATERKLIVGAGISLAGEISSCDHLVVEGRIEAKLKDCRRIDVADGGVFKGSAEIHEADIGGRFEGELTVRGRLTLRGSGVVDGTLRYGELQIETGGQLRGQVEPLDSVVTTMPAQHAAGAE